MDFTATNVDNPHPDLVEIPLGGVPDAAADQWTAFNGDRVVRNVRQGTLTAFHPPAGVTARGEAVIVAPGGGMLVLAMAHEGFDVARHLASLGYSAYVLKYRVQPTPPQADGFAQACLAFYQDKMSRGFGKAQAHLETAPAVDDLIEAVDWIRQHEAPATGKVHVVGFSAGAKVCIDALDRFGSRPPLASAGLIYFSLDDPQLNGSHLPPLFTVLANDDPLFARGGFGLLQVWRDADRPLEFHLFKSGGHGFGNRQQGTTSDQWLTLYEAWLDSGI
ncbi:alpha/beta hydrolase [Sphaerotilus mobilis]|uniref:Dienelactone hydrolase n=1 Tax=Sphaerotilus mobilis TaxID=47994 RepID=A0A4V2EUX2_9BURK|nr:dienelactone hydrolase family protein [Sphaerotilus mobilis]RZS46693.1 dienelactone hydrolase [Sphaerotilus mobilis]